MDWTVIAAPNFAPGHTVIDELGEARTVVDIKANPRRHDGPAARAATRAARQYRRANRPG